MVVLGGVLGALIGLAVGIVLTEVAFANSSSWPDVVAVALGVLGWLAGTTAVRSLRARRVSPHASAPSSR